MRITEKERTLSLTIVEVYHELTIKHAPIGRLRFAVAKKIDGSVFYRNPPIELSSYVTLGELSVRLFINHLSKKHFASLPKIGRVTTRILDEYLITASISWD
jgi:hypothetical protein